VIEAAAEGGADARSGVALYSIRAGVAADAALLARHRAEMWRDMGKLPDEVYPDVVRESAVYFARAIPAGEYHAWLAAPADRPQEVVAGAGLMLRHSIPTIRRRGGRYESTTRPQGLVVNVFTERPWRRRGLARLLMTHVIEGARALDVSSLVLHASDEGRGLYVQLGFVPTNEMRYSGEI
jgi:GNAT superfamily N-acetyltransferase